QISTDHPLAEYKPIGALSTAEKIDILRELGDHETANELATSLGVPETKSLFGPVTNAIRQWRSLKPWEYSTHSFGFLPASTPSTSPMPLYNAGQIEPDRSLYQTAVTIRLDKLRVADYPGWGTHHILFDFSARNAVEQGHQEHLHYNATFRANENQQAGVVGLPIFVNLNVGELGLAFECKTINVWNERSRKALTMLDSSVVKHGLELAKTAQPAIGPLSEIAVAFTKSILEARQNVLVQEFKLGLDFDSAVTGARLAEGSYFAVQVEDTSTWDWSQWAWHPSRDELLNRENPEMPCPYNYLIFRVSRHQQF
ncbi:MAG: hypothetical protein AAF639_45455, partial [Chloroflexota bacterium]